MPVLALTLSNHNKTPTDKIPSAESSQGPPGPPFSKKEGKRDLQDPELTKYTENKLTLEEISTTSPASTTGPVLRIHSALLIQSAENRRP